MGTEILREGISQGLDSTRNNIVEISAQTSEIMGGMLGSEVVSESIGTLQGLMNGLEEAGRFVNERSLNLMETVLGKETVVSTMEVLRDPKLYVLGRDVLIGGVAGLLAGSVLSALVIKANRSAGYPCPQEEAWLVLRLIPSTTLIGAGVGGVIGLVKNSQD